ncbi:MAG: HAD hydrolase family protein [Candidatus Bathyarchaeia archaeon]
MRPGRRVFITDCEGPISKNDNAFELSGHFIPNGHRLFKLLSRYDDVLAEVVKRPGYKAGDTLRLILPFLKAYGATDESIRAFSARNILLIPGAKETMGLIGERMPSFMISTSYEPYVHALCDALDFPHTNAYCTKLNIDKYQITGSEIRRLRRIKEEISTMPMIEAPENCRSIEELSSKDLETIKRLDKIFWDEISNMESGIILREVNPIGGYEKAEAIFDIVKRLGVNLSDVMYVGDSITDVQALRSVKEVGGLAVSFNGNIYAVKEADVAVLSDNTYVMSIIAEAFNRGGKEYVLSLIEARDLFLAEEYYDLLLRDFKIKGHSTSLPKVELITERDMDRIAEESSTFRRTVRGEAVGTLG